MTGPLFGLIVDSCHVNLLLEKTHFLVPTVVQVKQGQGHVGFNQHRTPDPVYVMSGGSTRNSVRSGAFYQDVKSSAPLYSFPLTVYPGGKGPTKDTIHPIAWGLKGSSGALRINWLMRRITLGATPTLTASSCFYRSRFPPVTAVVAYWLFHDPVCKIFLLTQVE